jgi:hypothetical protein
VGYFRHTDLGEADRERLRAAFEAAEPFPHAVFDDFVTVPPDEVLSRFPAPDWDGWSRLTETYQSQKAFCADVESIPSPLREMIHELGAPSFLRFLEDVSGLEALVPDPHLDGGGLHMSGSGGILAPHTDFHIYPRLGLYRRLNVIVYLNPDWEPEFGGNLALYDSDETPAKRITPVWGRCVMFATDDRSIHGFPDAVVDGRVRRSTATYYYTSQEAESFSGDTTTHWRQHGEERMRPVARARLSAYKGLLSGSRGLSRAAHFVNPHKRGGA